MSNLLWMDFETRSGNDIKRGAHVYAEDSEAILCTYAFGDGPVQVWEPLNTPGVPLDLHTALSDAGTVLYFHNVDFDRTQMLRWEWCRAYDLSPMRFYCTMVAARMAGMPGALDDLCKALGLSEQYAKKDGRALIRKFCVPNKLGHYTQPWEAPEAWQAFVDYARMDIVSMREAARRIPQVFTHDERVFYAYTALMNDRGITIDRALAYQGMVQSDALKARYRDAGVELGREYVAEQNSLGNSKITELSISSQKAIMDMLRTYGVTLKDARGTTLEEFLDSSQADKLPPELQQVLATRIKANKAATSKYKTILAGLSSDDRCRGTIGFYGAQRTGRDAGRRIQPQNLARPDMVGSKMTFNGVKREFGMEEAAEIIKRGLAPFLFENPLQLMSDCVRGTIVAAPGRRLCQADLANIEGRVCPWLANESGKLQYFRDFDNGTIPFDNYVMAYAGAFHVKPDTVTSAQRGIGKIQELASQFGGSVGAYMTFAAAYNIDVDQLGLGILANADENLVAEARGKLPWYKKNMLAQMYGLSDDVWTGLMVAILGWRRAHPNIKASWYTAEDAFRAAINNPGVRFRMARDTFCMTTNTWMLVELPSKRTLVYPMAREVEDDGGRTRLAFTSVNPFTKKWGTIYTGGPRLIENLTQAMARDCLLYNIPAVESAGYPIVLRIHDELICEAPDRPEFTGDGLAEIMSRVPSWCADMPMQAKGETYYRYQK